MIASRALIQEISSKAEDGEHIFILNQTFFRYLITQHVFHSRCFPITDARLKEARSYRNSDGLATHTSANLLRITSDDSECAKQ